jgi:putative lipoprotein
MALGLAILFSPRLGRAADPDPWFGRDKALHFGATATLASGGYGAAALFTDDRTTRWLAGGSLAMAAGAGKELWDLSGHGDASWRDLAWDAMGTATGLVVASFIDWLIHRSGGW